MRKLNLSMNRLQSLPKLDLPDLEWLSLARNQLGEIVTFHFDGLPKLAHLDLSGNRLKTILELKLPSLEWLSLARNRLNTLSTFRADMLPKLAHIDLSHNPDLMEVAAVVSSLCVPSGCVKTIALQGCNKLQVPSHDVVEKGSVEVAKFFMRCHELCLTLVIFTFPNHPGHHTGTPNLDI